MNKHLKASPHQLAENGERAAWWYEEPVGITVLIQRKDGGVWGHPAMATVSWRSIRNVLKRKDKRG